MKKEAFLFNVDWIKIKVYFVQREILIKRKLDFLRGISAGRKNAKISKKDSNDKKKKERCKADILTQQKAR